MVHLALWLLHGGYGSEMVMCAVVSVMVFYRAVENEGNGNVCCI